MVVCRILYTNIRGYAIVDIFVIVVNSSIYAYYYVVVVHAVVQYVISNTIPMTVHHHVTRAATIMSKYEIQQIT